VDDKTIRASRGKGVPLKAYTKPFIDAFFEDLATLNIERAEVYPAATDHVPEMIALIETLFRKGYAYQADDRSVDFSIGKFRDYGKLARLDLSGLRAAEEIAETLG
jgi:cysteinyl-tRNA synthetase